MTNKLKSNKKSKKKLTRSAKLATALLLILLIAELAKLVRADEPRITSFTASKYEADVDEIITFYWSSNAEYTTAIINFGDGVVKTADKDEKSIEHTYNDEGIYTVLLILRNTTWSDTATLTVNIINTAPQIDADIPNTASEDEEVNINVIPIEESEHDLQEGVLNYIYDFGDGTQNTTSETTFKHIWTTAGVYPITITAIDDQGAIDQIVKTITIINEKPEAKFTLGAEIPATYSFSEDLIGLLPFGWEPGTSFSQKAFGVVDGRDFRAKLLKITSNEKNYNTENYIDHYEGEQYYGSVEYQFMTVDTQNVVGYMAIKSGTNNEKLAVFVEDGEWKYRIDAVIGHLDQSELLEIDIEPPEPNRWYHIRIDFVVSGSEYMDLNERQFRVIIDGKLSKIYNFNNEQEPISYIGIGAFRNSVGESYIDSIGLSWDDEYNVGDNYHIFESSYYGSYDFRDDIISSEPLGWSINESAPSDITIVNMGENFREAVQLNDKSSKEALWMENSLELYSDGFNDPTDYWDLYNVDDREIIVNGVPTDDSYVYSLIPNRKYGTKTDIEFADYSFSAGHYPATYSFESDTDGTVPAEWEDLSYGDPVTFAEVVSSHFGHNKVIKLTDRNGFYSAWLKKEFPAKSSGEVEFWWAPLDYRGVGVTLRHSQVEIGVSLFAENYHFYYEDNNGDRIYVNHDYTWNSWHHHRILFNCDYNFFVWYIDDGDPIYCTFRDIGLPSLNSIDFHTSGILYGDLDGLPSYYMHFDAVGFSWDDHYQMGVNLVPKTETSRYGLYKMEFPYLYQTVTSPSELLTYAYDESKIEVYHTTDFDEDTVTWQNQPEDGEFQMTSIPNSIDPNLFVYQLGRPSYCYKIKNVEENTEGRFKSKESNVEPLITHYLSKNHQGNGILYMQTDEQEVLTLRSPNNINLDLKPNDKIEIIYNTTSSNKIDFNLLNSGNKVHSYTLSQEGNTNFNNRKVLFTVDDYLTIDQLEFTGLFTDKNNLIIDNIRIYRSLVQDLSNGTIEFYVRSDNVNAKTWALTLYNDLDISFSIMMYNEKWMYSSGYGTLYEITGCGNPSRYQWYHIRIDFALDNSGYENLNQHQFKVTINNKSSDAIYSSNINIDEINKIRFESGLFDEGIAYIDAIGYSWDEKYQVGDNKISVVLYPEKTNVQFSASDTYDTESDIDSLRYYWDFGDGLSGFGKYISHNYLTSGRYNVTLHVKDDNGVVDSCSKLLLIFNKPPNMTLDYRDDNITINEGDTIIVNGDSYDDIIDMPLLEHLWNFEADKFNPYFLSIYETGSWRKSHIYTDDFNGKIIGLVQDPEGLYGYDELNVQVNNVDPLISIYDVGVIANISLDVEGYSIEQAGNFSIKLISDEKTEFTEYVSFQGTIGDKSSSNATIVAMSLSKNWKIVIEALEQLPEYSWFRYFVKINYLNGEEIILDSGKIYGGDYGYWSVDLNQFWYDDENFSFKVPLTLNYSIWDPSIDDINLAINYDVDLGVKLTYLNGLQITKSFTINYPLNSVTYTVNIYESNGETFADISASQVLVSRTYNDNNFPINLEDSFMIYPIIDLDLIFNDYLGLADYILIDCERANNYINAEVSDDDGGINSLTVNFETKKFIDFKNLCPQVEPYVPVNSSMNYELSFNVQINEFDQLHPNHNFGELNYLSDDVPEIPEDFEFADGTIEVLGDLYFPDNNSMVLISEGYSTMNTVFEDNFNDGIRDPKWIDDKNFGKIIEDDGALKLKAYSFSYWGDLLWLTLAWAPYSKVPLSLCSEDDWEVSVNTSEAYRLTKECHCGFPKYFHDFKRHHWGLMLYQDDENVWLFGPRTTGYIQIDKIVDGKLTFVTEVNSTNKLLRIRKDENFYYFEHSPDGEKWNQLYNTTMIEIIPSDVGVFHKACITGPLWVNFDDFKIVEGKSEYILNFTTTLNIGDYFDDYKILKEIKLLSNYYTDRNQLVNLSIYNFATNSWTLINSAIVNLNLHEISWNLPNSDYYNFDHDILIKIEAISKSDQFKLYLDLLRLECSWTIPPIYSLDLKDPYSSEDTPNQYDDDINITNGIQDKLGDLKEQDSDYSIFNSSQNKLSFTAKFKLEDADSYDRIDTIDLLYSYKTDIAQLVILSIFNYSSDEWFGIDASIHTEFFNGVYGISSTLLSDFYNSNLEILVKIDGINSTENFQLFLDMLKIQYIYTPYRFVSSASQSLIYEDGYHRVIQKLNDTADLSSEYYYMYQGILFFNCTGEYLVTVTANDGSMITKESRVIKIVNPDPYAKIGNFPNITDEDTTIEFTAEISGIDNSTDELRFVWSFGDGTYAFEHTPTHAWSTSGTYEISLLVVDSYGNMYKDIRTITVQEQPTKIIGPFTYYGVEGQAVILDLEIYDSILDEINLKYYWYDDSNALISTDKKPILILENGEYIYTLVVKDQLDQISEASISIIIEDVAPLVFISNYGYRGVKGGKLELNAYGYDTSYDINDLDYYWTIYGTKINNTFGGTTGLFEFDCVNTTIYKGEIKVVDSSNKIGVASFIIDSYIDSNGNGYSDEVEENLLKTGESIDNYNDTDNDGYTDLFENNIIFTDPNDPDTDNDGLYDGFDNTGIGEMTLGTNFKRNDTDFDGLGDGFEFFGWYISTEYYGNIKVSSSPTKIDTDNDGLNDYEEFIISTDPRNPDTDNDGLSDGFDPYPTKYDYDEDFLSDGFEHDIGTEINVSDTDGDGLSDGEEMIGWGFQTNPLSEDTDHDFLSDTSETQMYTYEIEDKIKMDRSISLAFGAHCEKAAGAQIAFTISFGEGEERYGIVEVPDLYIEITRESDKLILFNYTSNRSRYISQVVDIRDIIENNELDYYGTYTLRLNNTRAGCLLEQYKIEVAKYLDPNDEDYDNDGIMDGIEPSLLVPGSKKIHFKDAYLYDNLTVDNNSATYDEFNLEIPYVGRVYDADLHIKIKAEDSFDKIGRGNVSISLIKEEINTTIENVVLIDYFVEFYDQGWYDDGRKSEWYFNLSEYLDNGTISEYYGNYKLKIQILETLVFNSPNYNNFTLVDFSIRTKTFIEATSEDKQAWITDPAKWDTDGDGWSDYYEIYGRGELLMTNPLSWDTDGDGVKDSIDLDPLYNIILEVTLEEGHIENLPLWYLLLKNPPTMQISVDYKLHGEKMAFVSPHKDAEKKQEDITIKIPYFDFIKWEWREKKIVLVKWMSTAVFGHKFYMDIEDDNYSPNFTFKLWDEGIGKTDQFWDTLKETYPYSPDLRDYKTGEAIPVESGGKDWIKANIKKISLNHTNTIAVYDNETIFNGHYNERDSMHVIQIRVNDIPGENNLFKYGSNTVVIPNKVFLETKLNSIIQNETNNREEFRNSILASGHFISLDRENAPAKASGEVESMFIIDCSAADAEEILNLALTGVINETTGEIGIINNCTSSEKDDIRVEIMNLPYHILGLIPIINNYENDKQGSMPMEAGKWWADLAKQIVEAVVGFFIKIAQAIGDLINFLAEKAKELMEELIEALINTILWLIELVIKAILLALIWILFAITLLVIAALFLILIPIIYFFGELLSCETVIELNYLKLQNGTSFIAFKYEISEKVIDIFDLKIPTIILTWQSNQFFFDSVLNYFESGDMIPLNLFFDIFSNIIANLISEESSGMQSTDASLKSTDGLNEYLEYFGEAFINGWGSLYILYSFAMAIDIYAATSTSLGEYVVITQFAPFAFIMQIIYILKYLIPGSKAGFCLGMFVGCIFASLMFKSSFKKGPKDPSKKLKDIATFGKLVVKMITIIWTAIKLVSDVGLKLTGVTIASIGLRFTCRGFRSIQEEDKRKTFKKRWTTFNKAFMCIIFTVGLILLAIELPTFISENDE